MHIQSEFIAVDSAVSDAQAEYLQSGMEPLQSFARRKAGVEELLSDLEEASGVSASRAVARLRKELGEFEPSVTLLGQVKSGKTTLVNALAGETDLLPSDVNPWTSVVTSLHLIAGRDKPKIGARFRFMTENDWDRLVQKGGRLGEIANRAEKESEIQRIRAQVDELRNKSKLRLGRKYQLLLGQEHEYESFDRNLLERYICIGDCFEEESRCAPQTDVQGRFADITQSADLYLNSASAPINLCLRDTPGVNDTFMMREQVTINAIRASRLCIVVLSAQQALTAVDMALIRMIANLKSRQVVIFVNRIDELTDPAAQIPEIEASIRRILTQHYGPQDVSLVFGSACWAQHVLSGSIEEMPGSSADSLLKWAVADENADVAGRPVPDMVWNLSGIPRLNEILSRRIVETQGDVLLERIVQSAITVAGGQRVANKIRVEGSGDARAKSLHDVKGELAEALERNRRELTHSVEDLIGSYRHRIDRAHANFVERAVQALIARLEAGREAKGWNHDPSSLRMMLKSSYSVFASRARGCGRRQYEKAVAEIAGLYFDAFGNTVAGIELQVPDVEDFPPPVSIAQTIALDFKDSWWSSWWRSKRGHKAFTNQYREMIAVETGDYLAQMKVEQVEQVRAQLVAGLDAFFAQTRDIMIEISTSHGHQDQIEDLLQGAAGTKGESCVDRILEELKTHLQCSKEKGASDAR